MLQFFLGCWFEEREVNNGETLAPSGNPCRRCTCQDGVITCKDPVCDCSAPGSRRDKCCPQCNPAASCRHQEFHHLVFRSGERWIYQCQTCECLVINLSELQYTPVHEHDRLVNKINESEEYFKQLNPSDLKSHIVVPL